MSVINKMLNDLDNREEPSETKDDVAFLQSKLNTKNQRTKKWWLGVASSVLTVVLAIGIGYFYYSKVTGLTDTLEQVKPVAQKPVVEAKKPAPKTLEQIKANQPKLVKLQPKTADGKVVERKSTLTVSAAKPKDKPPAPKLAQTQPGATGQQNVAEKVAATGDDHHPTPVVTQAHLQKPQGQPEADEQKMSIKSVKLSNSEQAQKWFKQGQKQAKDGMIQAAIEKYQQALAAYPNHENSRIELAALYYGRNMSAQALNVLTDGLSIEPGVRSWSLLAAKIYYREDNFAAAMTHLQLPVHPMEDVEYVALRAATLQKLKDHKAAARVFAQLTVSYPNNGRWWLGLATAKEGEQDRVGAIDAYRQCLRLGNISQSSRRFVLQRLSQLEN